MFNSYCGYEIGLGLGWQKPVSDHFVYFINVTNKGSRLIKIGYTKDIGQRLKVFGYEKDSNPEFLLAFKLESELDGRSLEKFFHNKFAGEHSHREYFFDRDGELRNFITGVVNG